MYAVGGGYNGTVTNDVSRFDPTANVWTAMSLKPTAVTDVRAVTVGNRIYGPGGRLHSGLISDQMESYEPLRDRWLVLHSLPATRSAYSLATLEGKIYLFGGRDGFSYRAETWQYDPDSDPWRELTPMETPRAYVAEAVVDQHVFVVGGENDTGGLTTVRRYSPASEDGSDAPWSVAAPIPSPVRREDALNVSVPLMLLELEGRPARWAVSDIQSNSWLFSEVPLIKWLSDFRVHSVGNKLHIMGGRSSAGVSPTVLEYHVPSTIFLPVIQ